MWNSNIATMKKQNIIIAVLAVLPFTTTFTSCNEDYHDEINQLEKRVDSLLDRTTAVERQLKSIVYKPAHLGDQIVVDRTTPVDIVFQVEPKAQADSIARYPERLAFFGEMLQAAGLQDSIPAALNVTAVKGDAETGLLTVTATPNGYFYGNRDYYFAMEYKAPDITYRTTYTSIRVITHPTALAISMVDGRVFEEIEKVAGNSFLLKPVYTPSYTTNTDVAWSTSDSTVAVINEEGLLTLLNNGDVTITLTSLDEPSVVDSLSFTVKGGFIEVNDETKDPSEAESRRW